MGRGHQNERGGERGQTKKKRENIPKQFATHRSCSFNLTSILEAGLIAGRHSIQLVEGEEFHGDLTKPRKVHHKSKVEALSRRSLLDPLGEGTRDKHSLLANGITCNHRLQHCATKLHQTRVAGNCNGTGSKCSQQCLRCCGKLHRTQ